MRYPWILFDADDTLFDFHKSARYSLEQTLVHYQINGRDDYWQVYEYINKETWTAFERQEITAVELRRIRFERFLDAIGEYREPLEMNAHYLMELSKTRFLIKGAQELMEELLEKKYRLGLITNGLKEVQRPRIAQANLEEYFKVIVVSDEIGVAKPHAGFFEHAFLQMGFPGKDQVLVVGDSLHSDIQGGQNFGLDTCWFNPQKSANLTAHRPTYQIEKLEDLKKIL
jgi:YjjG family noncanonical pyrimidine nucleotidase